MAEIADSVTRTTLPVASAAAPSAGEDPDEDTEEILVTGAPGRGSVLTPIPAEIRVERAVIRALGVESLSEVIDAFSPQARSLRGDGEPILLLDGRRIGNRSEIDDLPPEAILRVEIFPEEVALQYGYPPDRRVVNVILRSSYSAIILQASSYVPLGDGRVTYRAKANIVRLTPDGRFNLNLGYRRQTALVDSDSGDGADRRWRRPLTDRFTANGTYAHQINGLAVTVNGAGSWEGGQWKLGKGVTDLGLHRSETQTQGRLGVTIGAQVDRWLWSANGALQLQHDRVVTRDTAGSLSPIVGHSMRGTTREAQLDFTTSGPLGQLSAGQVLATFGGGLALRRHEARDPLVAGLKSVIRQDSAFASASLDIPLAPGDGAVVFGEGKLMAARGEGTLGRYGFGLRGSPLAGLTFSASYSRERSLPEFTDLAETQVLTPNVRVYDFFSGGAHFVGRLDGGSPGLRSPFTRTFALRVQVKPLAKRDLSFSLDYTDLALRNGVSGPLGATPQIEAAFPGRFERDSSGMLTHFDRRPLNIAREDRRQMRWGINLTAPIGLPTAAPSGDGNGGNVPEFLPDQTDGSLPREPGQATAPNTPARDQLQFAFYHTWTLEDAAVLRAGLPRIDLLNGAAIGDRGGASRHRLEAQVGYTTRRFGVRFSGNWSSPSQVMDTDSLAGPGGHRLNFSQRLKLDLRAFLNLNEVRDTLGFPWLDGRLYLAIDNLLGSMTRIRDENGKKVDYYRGSDEDTGRAIRLSFRKVFH